MDRLKTLWQTHNRNIAIGIIFVCLFAILLIGATTLANDREQTQKILTLAEEIKTQNVKLKEQSAKLADNDVHIRAQQEADERRARETRAYTRCHFKLFINYTHNLAPINIIDFNRCEAVFSASTISHSTMPSAPPSQGNKDKSPPKTNKQGQRDTPEQPEPPNPPPSALERILEMARGIPFIGGVI